MSKKNYKPNSEFNKAWKNSPTRIGFELYFQAEDDEKEARKGLYPFIRKLFDMGCVIQQFKKEHKNSKREKTK